MIIIMCMMAAALLGGCIGWNAQIMFMHKKCLRQGKACPCGFKFGAFKMKTQAEIRNASIFLQRATVATGSPQAYMLFGALAVLAWVLGERNPAADMMERWVRRFEDTSPTQSPSERQIIEDVEAK